MLLRQPERTEASENVSTNMTTPPIEKMTRTRLRSLQAAAAHDSVALSSSVSVARKRPRPQARARAVALAAKERAAADVILKEAADAVNVAWREKTKASAKHAAVLKAKVAAALNRALEAKKCG